jgi:uncharacterized membrane protein YhaH (DUF805 family)
MFKNPFSFEGRIRRTEYGLSLIFSIILFITIAFLGVGISKVIGNSIAVSELILFIGLIIFCWFRWAQGAKRCHDLGNSGWWQLIPLYNLWLLFADGEKGANQYGTNPKEINSFQPQQYSPPAQQDIVHDTDVSNAEHNSGIDLSKPS